MANLGTAYVNIVPAATGISGKITQAISPESAKAGISAGQTISKGIGSKLKTVGKGMIKAGAVATAISVPIIAGIKKSLGAYEQQLSAETKLTEIYKTRMGVGKKAAQSTMDLTAALQKQGVVGDEVQLGGAQQLATFAKMPNTVNTLLPAMNNLLVQQKGLNATQGDAVNIANLMGKVLGGQTGALKRVGITFTDAQEKVLKYGTESEKAAMLSQVITDNVGNMNEAMTNTPLGKIQQMKNAFGDLTEQLGAAFAPVLADIASFISEKIMPAVEKGLGFLQANPVIAKIVVGITGLLAVGGPLLVIIGSIVSAVGTLIPIVTGISASLLAGIGIAVAIAAAFALVYSKSEAFRNAVGNLVNVLKTNFMTVLTTIKPLLQALWAALGTVASIVGGILAAALNRLMPIISGVIAIVTKTIAAFIKFVTAVLNVVANLGKIKAKIATIFAAVKKTISEKLQAAKSVVKNAVNSIKNFFTNGFNTVKTKISNVFNNIKTNIKNKMDSVKQTIKNIIDKIKSFFPFKLGKLFSFQLPKISIGSKTEKVGKKSATAPTFDVSYEKHAKAMNTPYMFSKATLFGAGEAGDEILYGRSALMRDIAQATGGGSTNNFYINGAQDPKAVADEIARKLRIELRTV
ncbi:MAG: hypothetical protein IJL94_03970 [Erysipelotrichaceae bacterium]|nr:hypothetical protein [Erysipelotrichaceae bacterium]